MRLSMFLAVAFGIIVSGQTFKTAVDHVAVPITVLGQSQDHVADLGAADFSVFDDGRRVPIVAFGKVRQSLHILLLLDTSRSMTESLSQVRSAAEAILGELDPGDSIQVGTFSSTLRLSPVFSGDDARLAARVLVAPGANMTILYDALLEGCRAFTSEMTRRAIFVVSDGTDTASAGSPRTVMQHAAEANVSIYAVGLPNIEAGRSGPIVRAPDSALREIAEHAGGRYVYAGTGRDYATLFAPMIDELHQQYIVGFTPARADGRVHALVVTTKRPNVQVRARKTYMAPIPAPIP
jgi:VWFA-related protein